MSIKNNRFFLMFLPVIAFTLCILIGAIILASKGVATGAPVTFIDALFIATSCVCVTGLATIDIAASFNTTGHLTMMVLMQLGGLGITTYTALFFYMLTHRVSMFDKLATGQILVNNPEFHLGRFIQRVIITVLSIEALGMLSLMLMEPDRIGVFRSAFLAISAFCNAGFALWSDNLLGWQQHIGVNVIVMLLISMGGIGFAVLDELRWQGIARYRQFFLPARDRQKIPPLSFTTQLVLKTSAVLTFGGALAIFLTEFFVNNSDFFHAGSVILPALFQSVTCRTAGFDTTGIGGMTDLALLVMIFLMFVGGSTGSCAGGIKTGTFRILLGFAKSSLQGNSQVTVGGKGISNASLNKAFTLLTFALLVIITGTLALAITEGANMPHGKTPFQFLDILFEVISAFATVGLTTGLTPELTPTGKIIVCMLMFIGRLGPIWLISTLQQTQKQRTYRLPVSDVPIG